MAGPRLSSSLEKGNETYVNVLYLVNRILAAWRWADSTGEVPSNDNLRRLHVVLLGKLYNDWVFSDRLVS